ncbi:hypothetical protein [Herminiimonas contaminans]|uniref:Uncharacterized protein n=1 Tax=Herminiimonas contaminans TaxID=1111140 RepID=A0ABS0EXV5_9BURK|nr:hypothetical protein [Herminiimonas contaminans]MBF8179656.1 hypothetical protein [Herminiimonas contaminans]
MNTVGHEEVILESFKTALAAAYPDRIVTRSLKDFSDRSVADLKKGVFTVLAKGLPTGDSTFQTMSMLVVGQIELPEKSEGVDVERAESLMGRQVRVLLQRQLRGPDMQIKSMDQSSQLEVPYGWVSMMLEVGPYDATEELTEDEAIYKLAEFLTFDAAIDIGQPHQSADEHRKWLKEPPDFSSSKPDLQSKTDLPRNSP